MNLFQRMGCLGLLILSTLRVEGQIEGDATLAADYFRSLPEGSWEGNTGALASVNLGSPLCYLSRYGVGVQLGGSYGVYDWTGRGSALAGNLKEAQQQGFLTAALFRRGACFNAAFAYDWMFNKNFGVFALHPFFSQLRYEASFFLRRWCEFGVWGTVHLNTVHTSTVDFPVAFRAISQVNLFLRGVFQNCAEISIWGGVPFGKSLMFHDSRPGTYILGTSFRAPLTRCWSIVGHAMYMHPHHTHKVPESRNYAANISFGLNYAFRLAGGRGPRACGFRPLLPVANNSNFIADTSLNY